MPEDMAVKEVLDLLRSESKSKLMDDINEVCNYYYYYYSTSVLELKFY